VAVTELHYADSTFVARLSDELYDLIADVTRMGEWSPICKACWWDEGAGPTVGSWFTGSNELGDRIWETRCQVVAAERGREFAWTVGQSVVRWGYTFEPAASRGSSPRAGKYSSVNGSVWKPRPRSRAGTGSRRKGFRRPLRRSSDRPRPNRP
jgi:hypothetical protein